MSVEKHLPEGQFNNIVRWIKGADSNRLVQLSTTFAEATDRLRISTREKFAVKGTPPGSDQFDHGSLITWLKSLTRDDAKACQQVAILASTLKVRTEQ